MRLFQYFQLSFIILLMVIAAAQAELVQSNQSLPRRFAMYAGKRLSLSMS